jgi:predicted enzyme related to lactoylglutathione lyase
MVDAMSEQIRTQGRFVWHDLMTHDTEKARAFYTELAGWSVNEMDMGEHGKYAMFMNGETGIGGAVSLEAAPDIPSHWINYISVHDVDASCKKADELGGTVCVKPFDIPGVGRTAVVEDPNGAVFHLYRAADSEGPEKERPDVGDFCWYDCLSDDTDKAKQFYGGVFGWTFAKPPFDLPFEMWVASRDGKRCASIMGKPDDVPRSTWVNYLLVEDLEASTKRAEALGARKLMGPNPIPTIGTFNVIEDPTGAHLLLFENAPQP